MHQQEKQKTPIEADFSSPPMSGFMLLLLNKHEVFPEVFPISYNKININALQTNFQHANFPKFVHHVVDNDFENKKTKRKKRVFRIAI